MYYEINVSKDGTHHFATHPRSITDEYKARIVMDDLKSRFTKEQGFEITCTLWKTSGQSVTFDPIE